MKTNCSELLNAVDGGSYLFEVIFDKEGRAVDALCLVENKAAVRIFGKAMAGKRIAKVNPAIELYWLELYGDVARTGDSKRQELYAATFDRWYDFFVFLHGDLGCNQVGVLFKDITASKRKEEMLQFSKERNRLALEVLNAIVHDYDVRTGRFIFLDGLKNLTGYDPPVDPTIDWWNQLIHPDDLPHCQANLAENLSVPSEFKFQYRVRHRDGHYIDVEAFNRPFCGVNGQVVRIVGITVDISSYKRLERELSRQREHLEQIVEAKTTEIKRSERYFRTLIENAPMIIARWDKDLRYLYRSPEPENTFGLKNEEFAGKNFAEVGIPEAAYRPWQEKLTEVLQTGRPVEYEIKFPNKQGEIRHSLARVVPEVDEAGQVVSLLGFSVDITERKKLEAEMLRLDRLNIVGEMAATIGHEVRNPLTTVCGYLQFFQRKNKYAELHEHFALMIEELNRASNIISEFLSLAKNKVVEMKPHKLSDVLSTLLPLIHSDALRLGHHIQTELADIPKINLDEKEIRQMVLNLVRNGFEAMQPGGILTIRTGVQNGMIVLEISDTGSGIPKKVLDKLSIPFTTTKENGTGLGLPVCYRIAERHGAKINIQTSPQGTTVSIYFNSREEAL